MKVVIKNNLQEVADMDLCDALNDEIKIKNMIEKRLAEESVVDEKIYVVQQTEDNADYIVFSVHIPSLEEEEYEITIIAMSLYVDNFTKDGMSLSICAEVNHLVCDEIRYGAW